MKTSRLEKIKYNYYLQEIFKQLPGEQKNMAHPKMKIENEKNVYLSEPENSYFIKN